MAGLAVIFGSNALTSGGRRLGEIAAEGGAAVLQRHGDPYRAPHLIDHAENLRMLAERGCDRVLALASAGSLSEELPVGSRVCPDDFIALQVGASVFDDERGHAMPGFDPGWRSRLLAAWRAADPDLRDGGVYWQTIGPRFETPAEIRLMAAHADLVGMTMATESVIAAELGLAYAAICVVDNLANGIGTTELTMAEVEQHRRENVERIAATLGEVVPELAR